MKKYIFIGLCLLCAFTLTAQISVDGVRTEFQSGASQVAHWAATIDTLTTGSYPLSAFRGVPFTSYASQSIIVGYSIAPVGALLDTVYIFIQGSFNNSTWTTVDTVTTGAGTTTQTRFVADLNGNYYPFLRPLVGARAANRGAVVNVRFWGYR